MLNYAEGEKYVGKFLKTIAIQGLYKESVNNFDVLINAIEKVGSYSWYDGVEFFYNGTWNEYDDIKKCLDKYNVESVFLAGYDIKTNGLDIGSSDLAQRKRAIDGIKHWIDVSGYLDSVKMLIMSGPAAEQGHRDSAFSNTVNSLMELCDYNKNARLEITLEFFNDRGEPYLLIGPSGITADLARQIVNKYDNFDITYDLSHVIQLKEDVEHSLIKLHDYTNHIHIANCVINDKLSSFFGDKHPPFGIEGSEVSEKEVLSFLKMVKQIYGDKDDVIIGMEVAAPEGVSPDNLLESLTQLFVKCFNSVFYEK